MRTFNGWLDAKGPKIKDDIQLQWQLADHNNNVDILGVAFKAYISNMTQRTTDAQQTSQWSLNLNGGVSTKLSPHVSVFNSTQRNLVSHCVTHLLLFYNGSLNNSIIYLVIWDSAFDRTELDNS